MQHKKKEKYKSWLLLLRWIPPWHSQVATLHLFGTWTWLTTPTSSYPRSDQWPRWRRRSRNVLVPPVVSLIPLITTNEQSKIADTKQNSCTGA
jgi:hypothetical protein